METNKMVVKEYLGTGKIAKMFNVAPRTVAKWIDNQIMNGTRIPGSRHRRVAMSEVLRFAKEHNMPLFHQEPQPPAQDGEEAAENQPAQLPPLDDEPLLDPDKMLHVGVTVIEKPTLRPLDPPDEIIRLDTVGRQEI